MSRINEKNFPVFQKLIEEVFLKATGKAIEKISETRADDIADIIKESIGTLPSKKKFSPKGKSLANYINAVLSNDYYKYKINPEDPSLNNLAKYVTEDLDKHLVSNKTNTSLYWINFEKKYADLLLPAIPVTIDNPKIDSEGFEVQKAEQAATEGVTTSPQQEIEINLQKSKKDESESENFWDNNNPLFQISKSQTRKFVLAGMKGGIYAGILASVITVLFRYANGKNVTPFSTGYENISFEKFMKDIFTLLLLFQMIAGGILGSLCCYVAAAKNKFSKCLLLFTLSFIVVILVRQSMARDAWYVPGTYPHLDAHGKLKRMGGGWLGEPDFETLAMGLMGTINIFSLGHAFRKTKYRAFKAKENFKLLIRTIFYSALIWCLTYAIYVLLVHRLGILHEGEYLSDPSVFIVDFPHPERPIFAIALCTVYVFCFAISIQCNLKIKEESGPSQ